MERRCSLIVGTTYWTPLRRKRPRRLPGPARYSFASSIAIYIDCFRLCLCATRGFRLRQREQRLAPHCQAASLAAGSPLRSQSAGEKSPKSTGPAWLGWAHSRGFQLSPLLLQEQVRFSDLNRVADPLRNRVFGKSAPPGRRITQVTDYDRFAVTLHQ
jgi:hypothetical protein